MTSDLATCIDCGTPAPEATHEDALVSELGWRRLHIADAQGWAVRQWQCAFCARVHDSTLDRGTVPAADTLPFVAKPTPDGS